MEKVIEKMLEENCELLKAKRDWELYTPSSFKEMADLLRPVSDKELMYNFVINIIWSIGGIILLFKLFSFIILVTLQWTN